MSTALPAHALPTTPLVCHRSTPTPHVRQIEVAAQRDDAGGLLFRYTLQGRLDVIALPAPAGAQHTDGLWRHTCFEAFIAADTRGASAYVECNFSPSSAWATYRFAGYRKEMTAFAPLAAPRIKLQVQSGVLVLEARVQLGDFIDRPVRIGLTAVIEDEEGNLSYWALRHPQPRPDFHHRAGFILRLAAPSSAG